MSAPRTIVLVHGLWLTPLSWEKWVERYSSRGHQVLAPAWPRMDVEIEQLRRDPSPLGGLGLTEIVDHYDEIVRQLDSPPIIIGHSFGGAIVELLLDRGLGAVGVALSPAPVRGVLRLPLAALRSAFPALRNPLNYNKAVGLTPEQFRFSFTNTMDDEEAKAAYDRYQVPGPARVLFQAATGNLNPRSAAKVHFHNDRAPLLIVGAEFDQTVPASLSREAAKRESRSPSPTDYREYPGRSHFLAGQKGWEEIADYALEWATTHADAAPEPVAG